MTQSKVDRLQKVLDQNSGLRDQNFVTPDAILVFTEETDTLEEVYIIELPLRFPLHGKGAVWSFEYLGKVIEAKATLYRQSIAANELAEEHDFKLLECGTVVLVQHTDQICLSWHKITAFIDPTLN